MVRERRHIHQGLLVFEAAKRATDRANITSSPVRKSKSTSTDPRAFISVQIGAHWFTALIDPGSVRSYVDQKTGQHCRKQEWRVEDSGETAILADGSEVSLGKKLSGTITAANWKIEAELLVLPNLSPGILLGMDVLSRLGLAMFINGINITPKGGGKKNHACAIEGPVAMTNLKKNERDQAERFIKRQLQRFDKIKGVNPLIEHEIKLEDPTPIKQRYHLRNPAMQDMINQELDKMLAEGVVQPSTSPWSSPVVITRRKDGKPRFCVDFRRLNSVTKRDAYPLPQVNATLDKLRGARYLSTIDLKNGYWHVSLTEKRKALTAFTVSGTGLF